jgi:2-keto-4-pentenoate hydratase/2-oxohepta-3-ene-1,7-dioic acid hydratase in catechol pathway
MKLALFDDWKVGVIQGETVFDVTEHVPGWSSAWPYAWHLPFLAMVHRDPAPMRDYMRRAPRIPLSQVRLRPPIPAPTKIIAAPVNYQLHQQEMGGSGGVYGGAHIKTIVDYGLFLKAPSSIVGPQDTITLPFSGRRTDHEAEIGLVIGQQARNVMENQADTVILGFVALLDLSVRGGEDRPFRKSFDGFCPIGPWVVTKEEVADMEQMTFRLRVNGQLRQSGNTRDMIYSMRRLVALASFQTTLYPGDIIASGTPSGAGEVRPGDRLQMVADDVGTLEVMVSDQYAVPSLDLGEWFRPFLISRGAPV